MKLLTTFDSRHEASQAAAMALSSAIKQQLAEQTETSAAAVVSGGTSPLECLAILSKQSIEWQRVVVSLTDDRCVPADHPDSNQRIVREHLLVNKAADATYRSPDQKLPEPFAAVLVGMGTDGHFASLFPDADNLVAALDLDQSELTMEITTAASPYKRVSMPLARLLLTECLILLVFGDEKRALIDDPGDTPVRALFEQSLTPVQIFWAK